MIDGTLTDLAAAARARQLSPVEIVTAYLPRIERPDKRLRAFITLDAEGQLAAVACAQGRRGGGTLAEATAWRAARLQGPVRGAGPALVRQFAHARLLPEPAPVHGRPLR
jgi:Asp-tRNA(Asn)/Glu-tRNA(Gln) amidotransferase A subunit family amidase